MREAKQHGVKVLAVDSEHSAIFQCLDGKPTASVRKLWLTASGGPFRDKTQWPKEKFPEITVENVKKTMGLDITIVTTAQTDDEGRELLKLLGMPFRRVESATKPTDANKTAAA